ncbi:3291_t:CDS:2 [Entrophospora sp. SA101]|nr:3291_t:CDS:2 [Entrophospora sp. SA101]
MESDTQNPLELFREYNLHKKSIQLLDSNHNPVTNIKDAAFIQFDQNVFPKDMTTTFMNFASAEYYKLDILYHGLITKKYQFDKYNEDISSIQLSGRLTYIDRQKWVNYLNGHSASLNDKDMRRESHSRHAEKRRITDDGEKSNRRKKQKNISKDSDWFDQTFKPATYDMMYSYSSSDSDSEYYEEDEIIDLEEESGVANEESAAISNVDKFLRMADEVFLKGKSHDISLHDNRNSHSIPRAANRSMQKSFDKNLLVPLILVPSAPSSFINMLNVKDLLQDVRFIPSNEAKNSGKRKESILHITYNNRHYELTDNTAKFGESDWILLKKIVPGIYFKFIHRSSRHKDPEAYTQFWQIVEKLR